MVGERYNIMKETKTEQKTPKYVKYIHSRRGLCEDWAACLEGPTAATAAH